MDRKKALRNQSLFRLQLLIFFLHETIVFQIPILIDAVIFVNASKILFEGRNYNLLSVAVLFHFF